MGCGNFQFQVRKLSKNSQLAEIKKRLFESYKMIMPPGPERARSGPERLPRWFIRATFAQGLFEAQHALSY